MDPRRFDQMTTALGRAGTRRGLLGLLTTLPVLGGLVASLHESEESAAKGRHKHGKGKGKGKGKHTAKGKPNHRRQAHQRQAGGAAAKPDKCTPNKTCAQWCASVFGANTPAAKACTSEANKCQGLCSTQSGCLTNETPPAPSAVCCVRNSSGYCTDYAGATCCSGTQVCRNGQCGCTPECIGKECGPDGCGGQCGPGCAACETCLSDGTCSTPCNGEGCCDGTTCLPTIPVCRERTLDGTCQVAAVGTACPPIEGGTTEATCHADGRCCVDSGKFAGGVPDQFCLRLNCCSETCWVDTGVCF
jgi:hypothetical protein